MSSIKRLHAIRVRVVPKGTIQMEVSNFGHLLKQCISNCLHVASAIQVQSCMITLQTQTVRSSVQQHHWKLLV